MTAPLVQRTALEIAPHPGRVIAKLFLPGEERGDSRPRAEQIVQRVMALDEADVDQAAERILRDFSGRHPDLERLLLTHAELVGSHVGAELTVTLARRLVLGATFTAEYAIEGAAVCNPSAVMHPDQTGLDDGQVRVAISVRGIGEGHISSIGFCSAIAGPGTQWRFEDRAGPITVGLTSAGRWTSSHLAAVLTDHGQGDELGLAVLRALPAEFSTSDIEAALGKIRRDLLTRPGSVATLELLRRLVSSAYSVEFDASFELAHRVLMPVAADETNGMEDARFTRFIDETGAAEYRATYTGFDGHQIAPRLLTSPDLRVFQAHRMAGPAARNKGMALFPRLVGGANLALCRSDGESIGLTASRDGYVWSAPRPVHRPSVAWEVVQSGNCGPPIETERGWLCLTHGVGPMRTYGIGALLLDLDDPTQVIGWLDRPLLVVAPGEQDGYVPNVVYSCGAYLAGDVLWLPYGINDTRIGIGHASLTAVLAAMTYRD